MTMKLIISISAVLTGVLLQGCACSPAAAGPERWCMAAADRLTAMQAAEAALVNAGFQIDKYDVEAGLIRTHPLGGAQFFEFWRGGNADMCSLAEASLHSVMRTIELTFDEAGGQLCIVCEARVMRLSLPERNVSGTAGVYAMFTRSSPQLMTLRFDAEQQKHMAWVDLGLDGNLARKILAETAEILSAREGETK
ncbi:MAG TPA: hypothetical protein VLH60_01335 [Sedimentisphaerales bacterium]|nr:hypothetical protein [Sedimentisphaerales bacterium]